MRPFTIVLPLLWVTSVWAQQTNNDVPLIPYESVPNFLKYSPEMNLGETLGVAVNSKGQIMVLNHPGSANSGGPVYGNATSQLFPTPMTWFSSTRTGRSFPSGSITWPA